MGVLDEIKAISAQLGLGFGLSLAIDGTNSIENSVSKRLNSHNFHILSYI